MLCEKFNKVVEQNASVICLSKKSKKISYKITVFNSL